VSSGLCAWFANNRSKLRNIGPIAVMTQLSTSGRSSLAGKQVLVPLTSSLYVPGKLSDVENVVVDVGTGYYIKKVSASSCGLYFPSSEPRHLSVRITTRADLQTKSEAVTHYTNKTTFVQGNLEKLQQTIERKQDNAQAVVQVLQMKVQEAQGQAGQKQ